jgi:REP element-mobilizing transposase RayT
MAVMPRKPREELAGAVHHVYARGNRRERIFFANADRTMYLSKLGETVARSGWRCLAYCLLNNHVHLLIETPRPNLGAGMQWMHGSYAQWLNGRVGSCGHVFQGRYGANRITTDAQLWVTVRYIAHNPVEAGLVGAAHDWPWSSHAVLDRAAPAWLDVARLLAYFGGVGGAPMRRYRAMVG